MRIRHHTYTRRASVHGFTLLEALLALFIFSIAVISLVEAINVTARTVLVSRRERQIQAKLEMLLLEATRSPEFLTKAKISRAHESIVKEGDVTFTIRTNPLEVKNKDGNLLPDLISVSVTARWKEGIELQEVSASTWVFAPLFQPRF